VSAFREGQKVRIKGSDDVFVFRGAAAVTGGTDRVAIERDDVKYYVPSGLLEEVKPKNVFGGSFGYELLVQTSVRGGAYLRINSGRRAALHVEDVPGLIEVLSLIQAGEEIR
jgi:hypothetical protein